MSNEKDFSLNSPKRIEWVLKSLQNQHQLVSLTLNNSELSASSIVIAVSAADGLLVLDGVHDSYIHKQISRGGLFSLKTYLNGIDVLVDNLFANQSIEDTDGFMYEVPLPESISYMQRRESLRASICGLYDIDVQVSVIEPVEIEVSLYTPDVSCVLTNISATGCELGIQGEIADQIAALKSHVQLRFELPDQAKEMIVAASPRHCRYLKRSKIWLVGYQFIDLSPDNHTKLGHFVAKVQLWSQQQNQMLHL